MNPDRAFEQHTDLARALSRPNSPERAWWAEQAHRKAVSHGNPALANLVAFADFDRIASHPNPDSVRTDIITEFEPHQQYGRLTRVDGDVDLVGVVNPDDFDPDTPAATTGPARSDVPDQIAITTSVLADLSAWQITHAPTVYVTADMVAMLEHAAARLDGTDIMPRHPAYPTGFAVLARPIRLPYGDGTDQVIHAFAWTDFGEALTAFGTVGHLGLIYEFADRRSDDRGVVQAEATYPSRTAWNSAPDLVLTVADPFMTGTPVGGPVETWEQVRTRAHALADKIRDEDVAARYVEHNVPADPEGTVVGRAQPYLAALLLLLAQDVTVTREQNVNEFAGRRAARTGRRNTTHVTVVDIRRREHRGGTGAGTEGSERLNERHIVNGYWRWQPYGPASRLRKRIFVAAYVRGPEDAPLVARPRVRRL
jgi:hypothetical protein